jgi:predicted RNA-binding Zn ribbon-like protein
MTRTMDAYERVGGRLCLDFINTRGSHFDADAREYVGDYADLVAWLRACDDGLDTRQATRLLAEAREHPRKAADVFAKSRELRALLYRVIAARANGDAPARADLDAFNRETQSALAHRRLAPGERWRWSWNDEGALELPLRLVLASCVDLLLDDDPSRLRQCPAPDGCGWLFYDTSRNATRRWCSMQMCGNGAKARRFQKRHRASAAR